MNFNSTYLPQSSQQTFIVSGLPTIGTKKFGGANEITAISTANLKVYYQKGFMFDNVGSLDF